MHALLRVRFPLTLKVGLTALSAVGAFLCASGFAPAPHAALAAVAEDSPASWITSVQQIKISALHRHHIWHAAHSAHATAVAERAAAAKAYAAYEEKQAKIRAAARAAAVPAPKPRTVTVSHAPSARVTTAPSHATVTFSGGSVQACIISRESGGNPNIFNASGHYGLYQFSYSTWVGSGGAAADFGHASVAEQNQVFANAVAARGYSDWAPYDGC